MSTYMYIRPDASHGFQGMEKEEDEGWDARGDDPRSTWRGNPKRRGATHRGEGRGRRRNAALIKKKVKNFPHIGGNSDRIGCKVIYKEGLPNIQGIAQIFSHI